MKKITCFINDSNLLEKVADFCQLERFQMENLTSTDSFEYDVATVLYITDRQDKTVIDGLKDIPVCLISDDVKKSPEYILLPSCFQYIHLRQLIDAVVHNGCFEASVASVTPLELSKCFKVNNDIFNVERIVYALTKEFVYFLNFQSLEKVRVGLAEMLTNAIEHGNLAITGEEKFEATDSGTYYDLVNERLHNEKYMSRHATFSYVVNEEQMTLVLEDEGCGFDVNSLPDPTDPEGLLKLHGRGILITRMYFDEVKYNEKGNKVTLTKRF